MWGYLIFLIIIIIFNNLSLHNDTVVFDLKKCMLWESRPGLLRPGKKECIQEGSPSFFLGIFVILVLEVLKNVSG